MKRYIDDFVEDLNYRKVILYIGNVDSDSLRSKMESDNMGHTNYYSGNLRIYCLSNLERTQQCFYCRKGY